MALKKGDFVIVFDTGLMMLQRFAPPGSFPNNFGVINEVRETDADVWFPIDGDLTYQHSQCVPYPKFQLKKREPLNGENPQLD